MIRQYDAAQKLNDRLTRLKPKYLNPCQAQSQNSRRQGSSISKLWAHPSSQPRPQLSPIWR
jgi:hypothetical protein